MSENEKLILELVKERHDSSDGKCGISFNEILFKSGLNYSDLKYIMNSFYKDKKIRIRKGINGPLIFEK